MKIQKYLGGNQDSFDEMMEKVIDDVTKDWQLRNPDARIKLRCLYPSFSA